MVVLGIPKVAAPVDNAGNFTSEVGWALCGCQAVTPKPFFHSTPHVQKLRP